MIDDDDDDDDDDELWEKQKQNVVIVMWQVNLRLFRKLTYFGPSNLDLGERVFYWAVLRTYCTICTIPSTLS